MVLPPSLQSSLPAGWLAFTGRELNPLDCYKRFQITFPSSFSGFLLAQGKFHFEPPPRFTSLDNLVGQREQFCRHIEAERPGGHAIDDQLVPAWQFDRQVARLRALECAPRTARRRGDRHQNRSRRSSSSRRP